MCGGYLSVSAFDKRAADIVYNEFARLNKLFNFYDCQSELSRLNRTFNVPVKVSPELLELLNISAQVNQITNGAFDVSCGSLFEYWKKLIKSKNVTALPPPQEIAALKEKCGMQYVLIDNKRSTVTIKKEGLKIDLGGLAEGYMVDKTVQKLKGAGIDMALIDSGGDIYCLGQNRTAPWRVGIENPGVNSLVARELIQDEAITTAGDYEQFFIFKGKKYSHIISPQTGFPVDNNVVMVTVIAKNCVTADALDTAFMVMGEDGVKEFLNKRPSTLRIFMLLKEKRGTRIAIFK